MPNDTAKIYSGKFAMHYEFAGIFTINPKIY